MTAETEKIMGPLTEKTAPKVRKYIEGWFEERLEGFCFNTGKEDGGIWLYYSRRDRHGNTRISIPYGSDVHDDCDGDVHISLPDGSHIEFSDFYGFRFSTRFYNIDIDN